MVKKIPGNLDLRINLQKQIIDSYGNVIDLENYKEKFEYRQNNQRIKFQGVRVVIF